MKPSRFRTGLLTLLTTVLLSLGGTAKAQLEEYAGLFLEQGFSYTHYQKIIEGNVHKVILRGTIDTTPHPGDLGVGPVFGSGVGAAIPVVAYVFIDIGAPRLFNGSESGPVSLPQGTVVGDNQLQLVDDFVGYSDYQIMGSLVIIGSGANAKIPFAHLGPLYSDGLVPRFSGTGLELQNLGQNGPVAHAWLNDLVGTSEPEACSLSFHKAGSQLWMGGLHPANGFLGFNNFLWVYDSVGGNYAYGTLTSLDTEEVSSWVAYILDTSRVANLVFTRAKVKLASLKAKAKKKGVSLTDYGPYKRALVKYKRALAAAQSLGLNPLE